MRNIEQIKVHKDFKKALDNFREIWAENTGLEISRPKATKIIVHTFPKLIKVRKMPRSKKKFMVKLR